MNIKQFKYMLTVAKTGSISKAADELNISQPSLSQYIKKIEMQLNAELFDRTNGSCQLTDAGKVCVDTARQVLDLERQMRNKLIDIQDNKYGSITIGTTPFRSATMMPDIVLNFRKKYPGIQVIIVEQGTEETMDATERGEVDLSIITLPVDDKNFEYEIIMEEELVLAIPKNSILDMTLKNHASNISNCKYPVIAPKSLDNQEFVMITEAQVMQKSLKKLCRDYNLNLKKAAVVKSLEAQIQMVCAGIGSALVPTGVIKSVAAQNRVNYYSLSEELPKRKVAVIYRRDKELTQLIKNLINDIKEINW